MGADNEGRLPDGSVEVLSDTDKEVLRVIEHCVKEFETIHLAWIKFREQVGDLVLMHDEILGRPVNMLTITFERLYSLIAGSGQDQANPDDIVMANITRTEVVKKVYDLLKERGIIT